MSGSLKVGGSELINDNGGSGALQWGSSVPKGSVIEQFASPCDGSAITVQSGTYNIESVTSAQTPSSASWIPITGSAITYTPPTGTQTVVYEFHSNISGDQGSDPVIASIRITIGGTDVSDFRVNFNDFANYPGSQPFTIKFPFNIGGTGNAATGRQATWTSGKEINLQIYEYSSSFHVLLHNASYWENSSTDEFHRPTIGITALA